MISVDEILSLKGFKFPGGRKRIEHWENWLLTDCTDANQLPERIVHPVALFHIPIQGAGISITELFELGKVTGAGSVGLEGYDWEYFLPLLENVDYQFTGEIIDVERIENESGRVYDRFVFRIEVHTDDGELVARVTNSWRLWRVR